MVLAELVAGHVGVPVPVVVVAGAVVDPFSTVESVWVWVRPAGAVGVVFALVVAPLPCLPPTSGLCGVMAVALTGAGLCGCLTAVCRELPLGAAPPLGVAEGTVGATFAGGLGTEAT